jgi:hypothetical protein
VAATTPPGGLVLRVLVDAGIYSGESGEPGDGSLTAGSAGGFFTHFEDFVCSVLIWWTVTVTV